MDDGNALPTPVIALFRDLACVLQDARDRLATLSSLDAAPSFAVPEQDDRTRSAAAHRSAAPAGSGPRSVVG